MSESESPKNLGAGFRQYFEVIPALTEALRDDVFRIRHEVYCEEFKYFPVREDGKETDDYDAQSLHCLMRTSTKPRNLVGCTRLILARQDDPSYPLPFERGCEKVLYRHIIDPSKLPRDSIAEVSRLAVSNLYRRRKGEQQGIVDFGTPDRPRFPYIPIGLYLGTVAIADRRGIETLFLITEPRLLAHFTKLGINIQQIGDPVEYYGKRIPSMMNVKSIIREMRSFVKPLYQEVCAELDQALEEQACDTNLISQI